MAIPTEYQDNATVIGDSNIKHPIYTFKVLLTRPSAEKFGTITNQSVGDVLHPDLHDNSPDRGRTNSANHETQYHQFIPGFLRGSNIVRNDDGTFTAYGAQGTYLKEQYADIENPLLVLQNSPPYTSA